MDFLIWREGIHNVLVYGIIDGNIDCSLRITIDKITPSDFIEGIFSEVREFESYREREDKREIIFLVPERGVLMSQHHRREHPKFQNKPHLSRRGETQEICDFEKGNKEIVETVVNSYIDELFRQAVGEKKKEN